MSVASQVLGSIADVLGGKNNTTYQVDQNGQTQPVQTPKTRGQQVATIAADALRGGAAGAQIHGPGAGLRSFEAGAGATLEHGDQQDILKRQQASTDFEQQQQALARKGQIALQNQQIAQSTWQMVREQGEIDTKTADRLNEMSSMVSGDSRNKDYGHYASFQDFLEQHKDLGANIPQLQAQGLIRAVPEFSGGKPTGVHIFEIHPAWADQKNDEPVKISVPGGLDDKNKPTYKDYTIPAGGMNNGDILKAQVGLGAQAMKASTEAKQAEAETEVTPKERFIQSQETARALISKQAAMGAELQKKGMEDINKISSEGKDSYANFAAENNGFAADIAAAKSGDELAATLAKTMGIQNVNKLADLSRISPAEYDAVGRDLGSAYRQMATVISKAGTGIPPAATMKELAGLQQRVQLAKYNSYIQSVNLIGKNNQIPADRLNVFAPDGVHTTTLDKAIQQLSPPQGATGKVPGADGRMHWTDGKQDLGLAP